MRTIHGVFFLIALSCDITLVGTNTTPTTANNSDDLSLTYAKLRRDLMENPTAANKVPPALGDNAYPLNYSFDLMNIFEVNDLSQMVSLSVYLRMSWQQTDISWHLSDYNGMDSVWIPSNQLWNPRIMLIQGATNSAEIQYPSTVNVDHTGVVHVMMPYHFSFLCRIHFENYPFDKQSCWVGFYTIDGPTPRVHISDLNFPLASMFDSEGEWELEEVFVDVVEMAEDKHPYARLTLSLRRHSVFYVVTIIVPMTTTSVMIPLVFLIPLDTGEKMGYLVAMFTTTAVFLNFISDVMPRGLHHLPSLAWLLMEVMMESLLAVLASIYLINQSQHPTQGELTPPEERDQPTETKSEGKRRWCNPKRQNWIIFSIFSTFQAVFLIWIYGLSGWLEGSIPVD